MSQIPEPIVPAPLAAGSPPQWAASGTNFWDGTQWLAGGPKGIPIQQPAQVPLPNAAPTSQWPARGAYFWDGAQWLTGPGGVPVSSLNDLEDGPPAQVLGQGPTLSPDGKFYWDGERWQQMVVASQPASFQLRLGPVVVLVGASLGVIGCFLPWLRASGPFVGTVTRNGLNGDGLVILGASAIAAVLSVVMLTKAPNWFLPLVVLALAGLTFFVVATDYGDISGRVTRLTSGDVKFVAEIGEGIYLAGFGAMVWAAGALLSLPRRTTQAHP